MTDILLFDLFGVIARHQSTAGKDRLVEVADVPAESLWEPYWALRPAYDRGAVTGPEYWRQVADALGVRFADERIARLVEADIASWSEVDESMVDFVRETTEAGRPAALLSNIPEELAVHYEKNHSWLARLGVRAFSCRIGHVKPEADAYRWCLETLRVSEPERVLFVDDRLDNVRAAEAVGMRGHHFTTTEALRDELAGRSASRREE